MQKEEAKAEAESTEETAVKITLQLLSTHVNSLDTKTLNDIAVNSVMIARRIKELSSLQPKTEFRIGDQAYEPSLQKQITITSTDPIQYTENGKTITVPPGWLYKTTEPPPKKSQCNPTITGKNAAKVWLKGSLSGQIMVINKLTPDEPIHLTLARTIKMIKETVCLQNIEDALTELVEECEFQNLATANYQMGLISLACDRDLEIGPAISATAVALEKRMATNPAVHRHAAVRLADARYGNKQFWFNLYTKYPDYSCTVLTGILNIDLVSAIEMIPLCPPTMLDIKLRCAFEQNRDPQEQASFLRLIQKAMPRFPIPHQDAIKVWLKADKLQQASV